MLLLYLNSAQIIGKQKFCDFFNSKPKTDLKKKY